MIKCIQKKTVLNPVRRMATFHSNFACSMINGYRSYYDVLNVSTNSTESEIKSAFIELSKKYHPDANIHTRDSEEFVRVCEAYKILHKRASREHYNRRLRTRFYMVQPVDISYTNKNVHRAWVKYQASMRHKQFGHDVPSFGGATILHKKPLVIKAAAPYPMTTTMSDCEAEAGDVIRMPFSFNGSHHKWMYAGYMTGFSLVGILLALDALRKAHKKSKCNSVL
ncbi:uncharacterized protein LOC6563031 [Drosophila grimshawi]|uniref:GH19185 n=1 Tax=Drosophila grimshawi TaxID=7222 RepID=B4JEU5_DROGR|nr:uncharacterized protein LOC6563031 [Drosophila grimshawi]EDV93226.1 GH19185 [Drosophila grimshawi]